MSDPIEHAAPQDRDTIRIGQILGDTFALMRDRPLVIFAVAAVTILPIRLLMIGIPILIRNMGITSANTAFWIGAIPGGIVGGVMIVFGHGAIVGAVLAHRRGDQPSLLATLVPALKRLPAIAALALLVFLGEIVGLVLLLVPGIMAMLVWSVVGPALIAERTSIFDAFRRSQALTENVLGRILLLLLVSALGIGLFTFAARLLSRLIFGTAWDNIDYPFVPAQFLYATVSKLLTTAFSLCLNGTLYAVLVEARGDGPMRDHLTAVFE